ncbi:MBG domain-containing protein, partial [Spirulina sp. CCNP1310]|uniref:beta strand repeat-containing protein n=1 Tax=Spirulina sp. CCNP1310 TaxID=3110249 RepID=UPI002B20F845
MRFIAAAVGLPLAILPPHAIALPTGGQVVAGDVSITSAGARMDITQLGQAGIVNWADFGIGAGGVVNIHQAADAALLNRVVGANPSQLLGQLNAAGRVYLINPNGVLVGADARINAGSFFATTAQIGDAAFLAGGDLAFSGGTEAGIVNLGVIRATAGDAVLVAHRVVNAGEVHAPSGVAALGATTEFIYSPYGDDRLRIVTSATGEGAADGKGVDNSGLVDAAEARLQAANGDLYELAVNQTGVVRATGVERRDGRVLLTATGGTVAVTGNLTARNADGSGGEVLVGGDYQGANAAVPNVAFTRVGAEAVIDVAATSPTGDGGRAIVWADQRADFAGNIDGRAGGSGGDGAFAEVSGKRVLNFAGRVDLTAPAGRAGDLLLDPVSLEIVADGTQSDPINLDNNVSLFGQRNGTETSILLVSTLQAQLALSNVTLDTTLVGPADFPVGVPPAEPINYTDGSIMVSAPISWTSGNRLTFDSGNSIHVNANIDAGANGSIEFIVGPVQNSSISNAYFTLPSLTGDLVLAENATLTADTIIARRGGENLASSFVFDGPGGSIDLRGAVTTNVLEIGYRLEQSNGDGGFIREITATNPANRINILRAVDLGGLLQGDVTIADGADGLTVEGVWVAGRGADITLSTVGDLTLAAGAALSTGLLYGSEDVPPYSDIVLAAQGGRFINQAGAAALNPTGTGRFLIYSANPADDNRGGLTGAPVYNKTFAANPPGSITQTGNRFLHELAPVITVTANNQTREYGDANPTFTFTLSGLLAPDAAADVYSGAPTLATALTAGSTAGTYADAITVSQTGFTLSDYDYGFAGVAGDLTITPAPLVVTPAITTREFGDANPAITGTITGFKNSETVADLTTAPSYVTPATILSPVGTYDITASGAASPNYTFTYAPGTNRFSVTPAPLTIKADDVDRLYGAANPAFTATFTGLKNADAPADFNNLVFTTPDSDVNTGIGNAYVIRPAGATNANYDISFADGALTINPAPLTITAPAAAIEVGDPIPDPSTYVATFTGLVADDTSADYAGSLVFTNEASDGAPFGNYAIIPSGVADPNYTITFVNGQLTIGGQVLTITADNFTRLYGEANPLFTASFAGFLPGDNASVLTSPVTFSTAAVPDSPVGTYAIIPGGATAADYNISFVNGTLTVDPASLTIQAKNASRLYGAANPAFSATFTGLVAGDTAADIGGITYSTNAVVNSAVGGSYFIRPAGATNANYTISFADGALTINPAPLTVTAQNATRLYGAADPVFAADFAGFVAGDTAATAAPGLAFATNAVVNSPVGTGYAVTPSGITNANYAVTYVPGAFSITPAPLTITADNAQRSYGDPNPAFSATFAGLVAGDTAAAFPGLTFGTAPLNAAVGAYPLNVTGTANANYTTTFVPGELTVTARPVVITAEDVNVVYGETFAQPGFAITGLASFDTASVLGSIEVFGAGTNAGTYPINITGGANPNYAVSREPGTLTITRRPATITADDVTREYGEANPPFFTATYAGVLESDLFAAGVLFSSAVEQFSNVGTYAITPFNFSNAANYDITYVAGAFNVTPAPLTLRPAAISRVYGDANPTPAFSVTGLKGTDTRRVVSGATAEVPAGRAAPVGEYAFTVTGATATNYTITAEPGTLTVRPRPITIIAADVTRVYGDANPTFTIANANTNLLPDLDPINEVVRLGTTATSTSFVGNYAITPELLDPNYTLTAATSGTLRINPRVLNIVIEDAFRYFGNANPDFTYRLLGAPLPEGLDLAGQIDPRLAVNADTTSPAGYYTIIPGGTVDPRRYRLGSVDLGVLTVAPRPVTISVSNFTRTYPAGTDLSTITRFGDFTFESRLLDGLTGEELSLSLPRFTYQVFPTPSTTVQVVRDDYAEVLSEAGGNFLGGYAPFFAPLPTENVTVTFPRAPGLAAVGQRRELGIVPTGNLLGGNSNYAVTAIEPGRLTLQRPFRLSDDQELRDVIERPPLVVRSLNDYRTNIGLLFNDHAEVGVTMVMDHVASLFAAGTANDDPLVQAIFGSDLKGMAGANPATIRAWLSDIGNDPAKRVLLAEPLANYARALQDRPASTYTVGESRFVEVIQAQLRDERAKLVDTLVEARNVWRKQAAAAPNMAAMFDGTEPYGDFIKTGVENYLVEA